MANTKTINISQENIYGNCDLKCSYNFQYGESNSYATNKGVLISLSYDKGTSSPVLYNNQKYYVSNINIYNKSLHLFDGSYTDSELIIEHTPELGGEMLYVCIPIIKSLNNSKASIFLDEIINIVSSNSPREGEKINLNISNFNLNNIIPKKPFYAYTGTNGLVGQIIVFGLNNAIALNSTSIDKLKKIIKTFPVTVTGDKLFFNKIGPNNIPLNNGIYISCQPTGSSNEETDVSYSKTNFNNNNFVDLFNSIKSNGILRIILIGFFLIILFMIFNFGYNKLILSKPTTLNTPR